jgi:hypothetical protein
MPVDQLRSSSLVRESLIEILQDEFPHVTWLDGRLPPIGHRTKIYGGISTANSVQAQDDYYIVHTVLIQIFLPLPYDNVNFETIMSPKPLEDLVTNVINHITDKATDVDGSWYARFGRVDYPNDDQFQQTRAEAQILVIEGMSY